MKKSILFIILSVVFFMSALNIVIIASFAKNFNEKVGTLRHNLFLVKGEFGSYKSTVNNMLTATSDRVTESIEEVDRIQSEVYTSMLASAEATSKRIDSLLADFKAMQHKATSVKSLLK